MQIIKRGMQFPIEVICNICASVVRLESIADVRANNDVYPFGGIYWRPVIYWTCPVCREANGAPRLPEDLTAQMVEDLRKRTGDSLATYRP